MNVFFTNNCHKYLLHNARCAWCMDFKWKIIPTWIETLIFLMETTTMILATTTQPRNAASQRYIGKNRMQISLFDLIEVVTLCTISAKGDGAALQGIILSRCRYIHDYKVCPIGKFSNDTRLLIIIWSTAFLINTDYYTFLAALIMVLLLNWIKQSIPEREYNWHFSISFDNSGVALDSYNSCKNAIGFKYHPNL